MDITQWLHICFQVLRLLVFFLSFLALFSSLRFNFGVYYSRCGTNLPLIPFHLIEARIHFTNVQRRWKQFFVSAQHFSVLSACACLSVYFFFSYCFVVVVVESHRNQIINKLFHSFLPFLYSSYSHTILIPNSRTEKLTN